MDVDRYELALALAGVIALVAAWVPSYLSRRAMSLPVLLVAAGVALFALPLGFRPPDPRRHLELTERLTELGVIVSLMGAGLKLDRPVGLRSWAPTWRLLAVAMPLSIAAVAGLGAAALGLGAGAAVLLGAALAPTDPVLASEVQVGEPTIEGSDPPEEEDDVRFTLTSEGGLNDALAFPFVYLAIRLADGGGPGQLWSWLAVDVGYRVALGVLVGVAVGRLLAVVAFRPPGPLRGLADTPQGFVAIAATLLAYGSAELVGGYGFLAVFVAAVTLRSSERHHRFHGLLHGFADQAENLLAVGLLVLLGGALAGGMLDRLTWAGAGVALAVVLVVRPVSALVALAGSPLGRADRWAIAFLGIRGIGSVYYVAYAASAAAVPGGDLVWAVVGATVLCSILVHGVTATPAMRVVDRLRRRARRRAPPRRADRRPTAPSTG